MSGHSKTFLPDIARVYTIHMYLHGNAGFKYIHGQNKVDDMIFMAINYGRGHMKKIASVWRCSLLPVLHITTSLLPSSSETENSHVVVTSEKLEKLVFIK